MKPLPHRYTATAHAGVEGMVELQSPGVPALESAAPAEYDGPGDRWSPETLLVAAVGDCFCLTFRAIARASRLEWTDLVCEVEGKLDRVERVTRFVEMRIRASLTLPEGADIASGERLLAKAEAACLITNSLDLEVELVANVKTGD
ncbi:MAG TPA: OsmC family peroxiredoxin [Deltaproteobacteria bacterium]|nr:OsmC family peroxiredoxin [Deltaproteobacteria bacterium]